MGTLAFVMLVALASLPNSRGKEAESKPSIPVKATKIGVVIDDSSFSPGRFTVPTLAETDCEQLR